MSKKTPNIIYCSDCNIPIPSNTDKKQQLRQFNLSDNQIKECLYFCQHILCDRCMKKTTKRICGNIGGCDQCMWWSIT